MRRLLVLLLLFGALACAPATPIRRSALVPAASLPSRLGSPLHARQVRFGAEGNPLWRLGGTSELDSPRRGAPGLYVPEVQLGASFYGAPIRYLELGAQLRYASLAWSRPTAAGVLEIPGDQGVGVLQGGPGVRANIPLGKSGLTLSVITELELAGISQAVYVCTNCDGSTIEPHYALSRTESKVFFLPSITLQLDYDFNDWVSLFGSIGGQRGVRNIGFDPNANNLASSTLSGFLLIPVSVGAEVRVAPFFATVSWAYPLETIEDLDLGFGFTAQLGLFF